MGIGFKGQDKEKAFKHGLTEKNTKESSRKISGKAKVSAITKMVTLMKVIGLKTNVMDKGCY